MSHDITSTDNVVLAKDKAWHGLGTVLPDAFTVEEGLDKGGLRWEVEQSPLFTIEPLSNEDRRVLAEELARVKSALASDEVTADSSDALAKRARELEFQLHTGQRIVPVTSHQVNTRSDTRKQLAVVGKDWTPVQNETLAEFVKDIADNADEVRLETCGSVQGGGKVWFLARAETMMVADGDELQSYVLFANGHDGSLACSIMPTMIRVVCKNTYNAAVAGVTNGNALAYRYRHSAKVEERVKEARDLIRRAMKVNAKFAEAADVMAAYKFGETHGLRATDEVGDFFAACYEAEWGKIPTQPKDDEEKRKYDRAVERIGQWLANFEGPRCNNTEKVKGSAWAALNAVTEWSDHDRNVRKNGGDADHARVNSNLFGTSANFKQKCVKIAASLVTA